MMIIAVYILVEMINLSYFLVNKISI